MKERQTQREGKKRETETGTDRHIDRQRQRDGESDRQTKSETDRKAERQTGRQIDRDRKTEGETEA